MIAKLLRTIISAASIWTCLASAALAGAYEDGFEAYNRGDYATAVRLWKPLAEKGDAKVQNNLGVMYENGQGVMQDYAEAVKWYQKGADQGIAYAQYNLGLMYANGHGVPQDYVQSHKWLNLAAARASASEEETREMAHKARERVASKMTPAQIAKAQKLAREWKPKEQ